MEESQKQTVSAPINATSTVESGTNKKQKILTGVMIVVIILLLVGIVWLVLPEQNTNRNTANNDAATGTTPEPSILPVYLDTLAATEKSALLFFANKLDDTKKFQALIYNAETMTLVAEKEFGLTEDIKDSYFGNNSSLDPKTGNIYVSTVSSGPSDDEFDDCVVERFVASGCNHKLYRLSMVDDSQQLLYEAENLFVWRLTPDRHSLVIAEQVEPNLAIKMLDIETGEVSELASFSDITAGMRLADTISMPLGVSRDSSQIFLVMNHGAAGSETGWSVILRTIDLATGAHTDTAYEGPETRLLQSASFSNYSDQAALVFSKVTNNSFEHWLFTMTLADFTATPVANFDANNVTIIWGGAKKLFWQGKSKDLYSFDMASASTSMLPITPNAKVLPVAGSIEGSYLLYQELDNNHHYLYDTAAKTSVDLGENFVADSYSGFDNIGTMAASWFVAGGE